MRIYSDFKFPEDLDLLLIQTAVSGVVLCNRLDVDAGAVLKNVGFHGEIEHAPKKRQTTLL